MENKSKVSIFNGKDKVEFLCLNCSLSRNNTVIVRRGHLEFNAELN